MRRLAYSAVMILVLAALSACDGGGDGGVTPEKSTAEDGGDVAATDPACEAAPFAVDLRAVNVTAGLEPFESTEFEIVDAAGVKVAESAYTLYLADYEIDRADVGVATLHPPTGDTLVTLAITVFNATEEQQPIEVGDVVHAGAGFGSQTFIVIIERGADMYNSNPGPEGEVEVLGLTDDSICISVSYRDHEQSTTVNGEQQQSPVQKRLVGTIAADLV